MEHHPDTAEESTTTHYFAKSRGLFDDMTATLGQPHDPLISRIVHLRIKVVSLAQQGLLLTAWLSFRACHTLYISRLCVPQYSWDQYHLFRHRSWIWNSWLVI